MSWLVAGGAGLLQVVMDIDGSSSLVLGLVGSPETWVSSRDDLEDSTLKSVNGADCWNLISRDT